ncbi:hypothetical protein Rxycam_02770 [Rubrobacter xylanophilus DSM 9941]|uniref:DUF3891 family protein n=1 Tax=Rubrobacter xylanophilus TaxID=49319 RepID=UPI001C64003A|nr:DUF3891 family protein [Rubrobacter xylanophilus]QYJ16934.1 hypothetical protein Rxycam_02770 [Rubrobacter xylanophilus DSM 9941]
MIVRETAGGFLLVEQHEHGLLSGEFARRWRERPRPYGATVYAVANHDVGWRKLDRKPLWNREAGRPYSFVDYPLGPRLEAYRRGIDLVEAESPYAGLLCSMHYCRFVRGLEEAADFVAAEERRQERLRRALSGEELAGISRNFLLLRLCDGLSLFVCLNEPGRNEHPWYREGFRFRGERLRPLWEDRRTLRLEPNPFREPFELRLPYRLVDREGREVGGGAFELRVSC